MLSNRVLRTTEPNAWTTGLEERRARGLDLLDLTESNPTRVGLDPIEVEGLTGLCDRQALDYEPNPRGLRSAREAVSRYCADRGCSVDPDHIVLASGTSEAYAHLIRLLCDPGDQILAPRPGYPLFEPLAAAEGVRLGHYDWQYEGRWRLDLESLERAMNDRTRALIIVQPNHPTGSCLSAAELEAVETLCEHRGVAIISDEVFGDFPWRGTAPLPSLLGERRVPAFILGGLSKVCGLPQMKLSWIIAVGPAEARARALNGLEWLADLFLSVSTPVQLATPRWLALRYAFQARLCERIALNLDVLQALHERCPVEVLEAQGGWVALLRIGTPPPEDGWELDLMRRGVAIHPGYFYDLDDEACLVASLIGIPETMAEAVSRIEALVAE